MEIPLTVVGWKSTSKHTVQNRELNKRNLLGVDKHDFNHQKLVWFTHIVSSHAATFYVS